MKKIARFVCALFVCTVFTIYMPSVFAQTDDIQSQHEDEDIARFFYTKNQRGDQNFRISIAPVLPLSFGNPFHDGQLKVGGMGTLGYHYFLSEKIALGFDAGFGFNLTIGGNALNYVPLLLAFTYQPSFHNFEFPLTISTGFAWETYSGYTYWPGWIVRPQVGVHYRITPSWSLGVDVSYMFMPQFSHLWNKEYDNYYGHFVDIALVAKYYF